LHEKSLDVSSGYKREKDLSDRIRQLEDILLSEEEQVAKKTASIGELQDRLRELEEAKKMLEKDKASLNRKLEQSEEDHEGKELTIANQSQQIDELKE
jgi:chromosome segregation ATPase